MPFSRLEPPADHSEEGRLAVLASYHILGSGPEEAFDRVARLASHMFAAPIALISLIDDQAQWVKSAVGADVKVVPLAQSLCAEVLSAGTVLVVPDVTAHPQFAAKHPIPSHPQLGFFASAPLVTRSGHIIGAVSVFDAAPRPAASQSDYAMLGELASIVVSELDLRKAVDERDSVRSMLERALDFGGLAIWRRDLRTGRVDWGGAVADVWGEDAAQLYRETGSAFERVFPDDREALHRQIDSAIKDDTGFTVEMRIMHPAKGLRWLLSSGSIHRTPDAAYLIGISFDITEPKLRQEMSDLLTRELHHRMRNLFSTVRAMISLSRPGALSADDYAERLLNRLYALDRAQHVLLNSDFLSGSMHALLHELSANYAGISWSGPDQNLDESTMVALALIINELGTNATRYGALSAADGRVALQWAVDDGSPPILYFTWVETGGPRLADPQPDGFGTQLLERIVRDNLGGTIVREWAPEGLKCILRLPMRWASGLDPSAAD